MSDLPTMPKPVLGGGLLQKLGGGLSVGAAFGGANTSTSASTTAQHGQHNQHNQHNPMASILNQVSGLQTKLQQKMMEKQMHQERAAAAEREILKLQGALELIKSMGAGFSSP